MSATNHSPPTHHQQGTATSMGRSFAWRIVQRVGHTVTAGDVFMCALWEPKCKPHVFLLAMRNLLGLEASLQGVARHGDS